MASAINLNCVNRFRLHQQHLSDASKTEDTVQIARDIYGLHATNPTAPYLSLFARARDFTRDKLDKELYVRKSLGKIRCVRTTVHVLPRETMTRGAIVRIWVRRYGWQASASLRNGVLFSGGRHLTMFVM